MAGIGAVWLAGSGDWFGAGNWQEPNPAYPPTQPIYLHYVPTSANDVYIGNNTSGTETISYAGTDTVNTLDSAAAVNLSMTSGSLTSLNGGAFDTLTLASGATFSISSGVQIFNNGSLSGTLAGAGRIDLFRGSFSLNAGLVLSVATFELGVSGDGFGADATLNTDLTYGGTFKIDDYSGDQATLHLNGHTLTLTGTDVLDGTFTGPGLVKVTGTADEVTGYGGNTVTGGATLEIVSGATITQEGSVFLGDSTSTGTLKIDAGGIYNITQTASIGNSTQPNALINNAGLFEVTGTAATVTYNGAFTNSGTISIAAGDTLSIAGVETLGGTISGAGTLSIGFAAIATFTTTTLSVGAIYINGGNGGGTTTLGENLSYAGKFTFVNNFGSLALNGDTLTLSGSSFLTAGNIIGNSGGVGTVKVTGIGELAASIGYGSNAATIEDAGTVTQDGNVSLHGLIKVDAGAAYTMTNGVSITDNGATTSNAGTLRASGTSGQVDDIDGTFTNTGTLTIDAGVGLRLAAGTETLSGAIAGAGTLYLGFAHNATISTANVTVASLYINGGNGGGTTTLGTDLSYGGSFTFLNGFGTLALNGHTLTLTGSSALSAGNIVGGAGGTGTVKVTGTGEIAASIGYGSNAATLEDAGTLTQDGNVSLHGLIQVDAGATYTIGNNLSLTDAGGSKISNAGKFVKAAGTGTTDVYVALDNTGTLEVDAGTLYLHATTSNEGTFSIAAGASAITSTLVVSSGGQVLVNGTLTLAGAANCAGATVAGSGGTIVATGNTFVGGLVVGGTLVLQNNGTLTQTGAMQVGDGSGGIARIGNRTGATYNIYGDVGIGVGSNPGSYFNNNGGTLAKTGGAGVSLIATDFQDVSGAAAKIQVGSGTLQFNGASNSFVNQTISGAGTFAIGGGGSTVIGPGTTITTAAFGISHVNTVVTLAEVGSYAGSFSMVNSTTLSLGANTLTLTGSASFAAGAGGSPVVTGNGKLVLAGATSISGLEIGGTLTLRNTGTITETGTVQIGDPSGQVALLTNAPGGTYIFANDSGITQGGSIASMINNGGGTIIKSGGTGTSTITACYENLNGAAGTVEVASGTLAITGTVTGNTNFLVDAGKTMEFDNSVAAGSAVSLLGAGSKLRLGDAQQFGGTIAGFGSGTALDLRSIGFGANTTLGYSGDATSGTLTVSDGTHTANLTLLGQYSVTEFQKATDNHGGTSITFVAPSIALAPPAHHA